MADLIATTVSNVARLKDPEAVKKILGCYLWEGDVEVIIRTENDGEAFLVICGYDWPIAWKILGDLERDDFEPDCDSDDDFEDFLKEVSLHLAEPLTVQSIGGETFPLMACEWHVRPGETSIEVNGFQYSDQR